MTGRHTCGATSRVTSVTAPWDVRGLQYLRFLVWHVSFLCLFSFGGLQLNRGWTPDFLFDTRSEPRLGSLFIVHCLLFVRPCTT